MQIEMKPDTAIEVLITKVLPKLRDTWEHDALVLAIEALKEKQTNGNNDSIFTRQFSGWNSWLFRGGLFRTGKRGETTG